jgi:hypothetical protein
MNTGKYVFSQVCSFLPFNEFIKCVERYDGNRYVKHFTCWNQLSCMLFGQLCSRQSLSDLIICLQSQQSKWYHLGMGSGVSKSNLAYSNERRNWKIFADFAYVMVEQARKICVNNRDFELEIDGNVYAIDSTTIDLCLNLFPWAPFRKTKAAIKLHTQFDIKTEIPTFVQLSDGKVHDVNILDKIIFEKGAFYVMDRAYVSFKRLAKIDNANAFFITRSKTNSDYRRLYSNPKKCKAILCDQIVKLKNFYPLKYYPKKFRKIKYRDHETNRVFEFITNNFDLDALEVAKLYKYRWKIELFFKWIKQHLQVATFWGHSENAVRIQIFVAIIAYAAVAMIKEQKKIKHTTYEILQILSITLLNKIELNQLFDKNYQQNFKELNDNQLIIF